RGPRLGLGRGVRIDVHPGHDGNCTDPIAYSTGGHAGNRKEHQMRVLSFSPHPDDTEAYCGGTLAKYAAMGHAVGIVTMTRGDVGSPALSRDEIAAVREQEARNAAALIGAELFWLGYDDEFLYDTPEVRRR